MTDSIKVHHQTDFKLRSPTVENYLKAMLSLSDEDGRVNVSDLSKALGVSTPSANSMVKKLADSGLILYKKYRPLRLTEEGRRAAALIVRKHRLTEMFLVEKMGFGWEEVHPIAEQIEHVKSPEFFARMDELMGFPTTDPHGSPIPDPEGNIASQKFAKLSEVPVGKTVTIAALADSSESFLLYLNDRQLALGVPLTVLQIEPFDGSMTVSYPGQASLNVSKVVGDKLLVSTTKG
jgi:DtxR family Mn-dependent transcriptional regulator